ncbi:glycosyltransferase [Cyclobacterium sediminis]
MKTEVTEKRMPPVSVCLISYNHAAYIERALDGIFMQIGPFDLEVIISDDCSSDDTREIIERKISQNNSITVKYFPQESNLGIIENFVFALNQCTGKYIAICEGDDYWLDNKKLAKQTELLENDNTFVGSFHFVKVEYEGKPYLSNIFQPKVPEVIGTEDLISPSSLIHTSSLFFKRAALIFPDWYSTMLSGDFALTSILSKKGAFKRINEVMSVYRVHEQGVTNSRDYNRKNKILKTSILEKLNQFHEFKYDEKFIKVIIELNSVNSNNSYFNKLRRRVKFGLVIKRFKYWLKNI